MKLLLLAVVFAAVVCVALVLQRLGRPSLFRHYALAGVLVFGGLAGLLGYFVWRESRTLEEIGAVIAPVPEVTGVMRVPSPEELRTIANAAAAVPFEGRFGTTQEERQELADEMADLSARYWQVYTALSAEEAIAFYRAEAASAGWAIDHDEPPYLMLSRADERLMLIIQDDWKRGETEVWYVYEAATRQPPS